VSLEPSDDDFSPTETSEGRPERQRAKKLERGSFVGRYMLVDQLGAGGMGVVYKAYDPELNRPIALKLLQTDEHEQPGRERLLREAQALAQLNHPNVIAVYDAGSLGSRVFIATEFVDGLTLRKWRSEASRSQREILDVFFAAGEGLAAAHRAGLVHRDFKPDNVMVGKDGRVRVLDFGLVRADASEARAGGPPTELAPSPDLVSTIGARPAAKQAVEASQRPAELLSALSSSSDHLMTPLTYAGAIMGTPRYMAPEQHLGEPADARADQFSFCLSLYEALYGSLPFDGATFDQLRAAVLAGRVADPPPSARVPRWMRQVLLRGLATLPGARYPSMTALLAALRQDPHVQRRRRIAIGGLLATVGVAVLGWRAEVRYQVRACHAAERALDGVWDEARRTAVRAVFHRSGVPYAEAALATVERTLDAYARAWVRMSVDSCEATNVRHEQSEELLTLRSECLADRRTRLKSLTDLYQSADPKLIERAAQSAESLPGLDLCADAASLRSPTPPPRDVGTRRRIDELRQKLSDADALGMAARYGAGIRIVESAIPDARSLHYPRIESEAQFEYAILLGDRGDYPNAGRAYYQALVAAVAAHDEEAAVHAIIGMMQAIGVRQGHSDEGDRWAGLAEAQIEQLPRKDELLGRFLGARSALRSDEARYDDALADASRALEIEERLFGPDSHRVAAHLCSLGHIQFVRAQYSRSLEAFQRCLAIEQRTLGPNHPLLIEDLVGIANVYGESGDHERAVAEYQRALETIRRIQPDHPVVMKIYNNMGTELFSLGRFQDSFDRFEGALEAWRKRPGPPENEVLYLNNMGDAKLSMNQPEEALKVLLQATDPSKTSSVNRRVLGIALTTLAEAYRRLNQLDQAQSQFRTSLATLEKAFGPKHPELARTLLGLGRVELVRRSPHAKATLERALAIREAEPGDGLELADIRFALAQALWQLDDRARAVGLATQARDAFAKAGASKAEAVAEAVAWLSRHR
jgi:serine/threonine protein kinase/Tfp pilus assembly protein PilF